MLIISAVVDCPVNQRCRRPAADEMIGAGGDFDKRKGGIVNVTFWAGG